MHPLAKYPFIIHFRGERAWLSNFFEGCPTLFAQRLWPTREHLFQALKCANLPNQYDLMEQVRLAETPKQAKYLGRKIPLRPDWDFIQINAMLLCLGLFLIQYPEYQEKLAATKGTVLVEGVWWNDAKWGQPLNKQVIGLNLLGTLWMAIRDDIIPLHKIQKLIELTELEYACQRGISSPTNSPVIIGQSHFSF